MKALEDRNFVRDKAGVALNFGPFPRDRISPNGGSTALGHPFGATDPRRRWPPGIGGGARSGVSVIK
jgi:acetyl-CoA C-acetyltransferase